MCGGARAAHPLRDGAQPSTYKKRETKRRTILLPRLLRAHNQREFLALLPIQCSRDRAWDVHLRVENELLVPPRCACTCVCAPLCAVPNKPYNSHSSSPPVTYFTFYLHN